MGKFLVPVLVMASLVPVAAADRTARSVPLTIDNRGGVLIDVRVNDAGPFTFLVDTGAGRSVIADDLARQVAAPVVAKSEVVTSVGSDMRLVVRLASVTVASARMADVLAPTVPASQLARLAPGVRGVLGQDFLSAFNYTLDYRRRRLTWDEPRTCGAAGALPMIKAEGRFVVALEGRDGAPLRLVPDSGSEVLVLFHTNPAPQGSATIRVSSVGAGDRAARPIPIAPLRVGGATLRDSSAYLTERVDADADGLLPLHGFSSVSFGAGGACLVARR
ncbi:MAG: retropepsin-like aspartic protease [Vicinamibacterales bacterium]